MNSRVNRLNTNPPPALCAVRMTPRVCRSTSTQHPPWPGFVGVLVCRDHRKVAGRYRNGPACGDPDAARLMSPKVYASTPCRLEGRGKVSKRRIVQAAIHGAASVHAAAFHRSRRCLPVIAYRQHTDRDPDAIAAIDRDGLHPSNPGIIHGTRIRPARSQPHRRRRHAPP